MTTCRGALQILAKASGLRPMAFDAILPGQIEEAIMSKDQTRKIASPSSQELSPIEKLIAGQKGPLPMDTCPTMQDENEEFVYGDIHSSEQDGISRKDPFGVREQIRQAYPNLTEEELDKLLDAFGV